MLSELFIRQCTNVWVYALVCIASHVLMCSLTHTDA